MDKKSVNLDHLRMAAERSADLASQVASAASEAIEALDQAKQDTLTGAEGQVVGFNAAGEAVAQDAPSGGLTQEEADRLYIYRRYGEVEGGLILGETAKLIPKMLSTIRIGLSLYDTPSTDDFGRRLNGVTLGLGHSTSRYNVLNFYSTKDEILIQQSSGENDSGLVTLRNICEPSDDTDAANKGYVDNAVSSAVGDISAVLDAINGEVI